MSKGFKIFLIIMLLIIITALLFIFVVHPRQILGNNAGKYHNMETVYTMKKQLYTTLFGSLKKNDVVLFTRPDMENDGVAVIVALPGEKASENAYYFSNEKVKDTVPINSYLVQFGESKYLRVVPDLSIFAVVWLPVR